MDTEHDNRERSGTDMKLLMCDDDISTLDVIQNQVDWAELGISRISEPTTGTRPRSSF